MKDENIVSQSIDYDKEPLLVIEYMTSKVFWRLIFPNALLILIAYGVLSLESFNIADDGALKYYFGIFFWGSLSLFGIMSSLELLLMKEIRFYSKHIEKEWGFFGIRSFKYKDIQLLGNYTFLFKVYGFVNMDEKIYKRKLAIDLNLCSLDDVESIKGMISSIFKLSIEELEQQNIKVNLSNYSGENNVK